MSVRIVVGVDGSPHARAALRWAIRHAEALAGEVTAVFAWQLPLLSLPGAFDRDDLENRAKTFLLEVISTVEPSPKVPLASYVAEGDPTEVMIKASGDATLLVLGTRGRSPFKGLLLGSVSQGCATSAPCPVVIVKQTDCPAPSG
jgi:nucleotide-binding universal stress UspA family protein